MMVRWPITLDDVLAARDRIRPYVSPTPLRHYGPLDAAVSDGVPSGSIRVLVKHENHQPTNAFKVRNALSVLTALSESERSRGVVAASRGNYGLGLAWAGWRLGVKVTICVPVGNNPEKNEAMRHLGVELIERGRDYDDSVEVAEQVARESGARVVHATDDPLVLAGAGTMALEILEDPEASHLDAIVLSLGGGSQAVGAMTVARALRPGLKVYAVQAERASVIHDSWHARRPLRSAGADTFADGIATRCIYDLTFGSLLEGLAGFVKVSEQELAASVRLMMRATHNLAEGAGAAGLAGLMRLRAELGGRTVAIVNSGANIDAATLRWVMTVA